MHVEGWRRRSQLPGARNYEVRDGLSGQSVAAVTSVTVKVANAVWRMQCSHPKCRIVGGIHEMDESEVQYDKGPAMRGAP